MTRTDYRRCETCLHYSVAGDRGECHASLPQVAPHKWPQMAPTEVCEAGFRLNPARLFDRIDELDRLADQRLDEVTRLEFEVQAVQEENERLSQLLGQSVQKRIPLPQVTAEVENEAELVQGV